GDIHGDLVQLLAMLGKLPPLTAEDTLVFLGDYLDRGPSSAGVVHFLRFTLPGQTAAKLVFLRGNHEDAWLRVCDVGWEAFLLPPRNGCLAAYRSWTGGEQPRFDELPTEEEWARMEDGDFLPDDVVAWMRELLWWYEDDHAIYVHAGLPWHAGRWLHPAEVSERQHLVWTRKLEFFTDYRGKTVVVGHTTTGTLPPELDGLTPGDPEDVWMGAGVWALDTGCGKGGFLTCLQLPDQVVYDTR
ncbi:MAG: metallophosphoesterase, partial [Deltaproteobacteria bacterium]|nr:metallophosphoesterase [Deltaproteobacteria bacterium]